MIRRAAVWGLVAGSTLACFAGEFLVGVQCQGDAECGPQLSCVDGYCSDGLPPDPALDVRVSPSPVKRFVLTWTPTAQATRYEVLERSGPQAELEPRAELGAGADGIELYVPLHLRAGASYVVRACNRSGCADAEAASLDGVRGDAVGRFEQPGSSASLGRSVALSADGATLAAGAFLADIQRSHPVFVFVRDLDGEWSEAEELTIEDDGSNGFGEALALSPDGGVIAIADADEGGEAGAVHLFRREAATWQHAQTLAAEPNLSGARFGDSLCFDPSGAALVVGAPADGAAGSVHVFGLDADAQTWSWRAKLEPADLEASAGFGVSVAASAGAEVIAVGAPGSGEASAPAGRVHVFSSVSGADFTEQTTLQTRALEPGDRFGARVGLSEDGATLAVAAPGEDGGGEDVGGVYVFADAGGWAEQARLAPINAEARFGENLALAPSGELLAVANPFDRSPATGLDGDPTSNVGDQPSGAVEVFTRASGSWTRRAYVKAPVREDESFAGCAGVCVALGEDGETLAIGAPNGDGVVYLY